MFLIELNANGQRADYHTKGALHKGTPHSGFIHFLILLHLPTIKQLSMCVCKLCMCLFDSIIANLISMYMHGWWETAVCKKVL